MLNKLAKLLSAEITEMHHGTFEITARAPKGYVWADNGQEEIHDEQWEGEGRNKVRKNIAERMQKGLEPDD